MTRTSLPAAAVPAAGSTLGTRIDALDGLRGLAIIGVLAEHTLPWSRLAEIPGLQPVATVLSMGWIGVELFFVISGYLITRVLLRAQGEPRYYRNFWGRRAARIVPGYALLIAAVYLLLPPAGEASWLPVAAPEESALWYALFLVNFFPLLGFLPHQFLLLTWSVAVEQQFYLAWPLVCRRLTLRHLAIFAAALFLLSTVSRLLLHRLGGVETSLLYYLGATHLDGIAAGALVGCIGAERILAVARRPGAVLLAAALAAAGATLWAALHPLDGGEIALHPAMSLFGYGSFALLFALLLAEAVAPGPAGWAQSWRAFLELPLLRFIGRISYSLYLAHLPVAWLVAQLPHRLGLAEAGPGSLMLFALLGTALAIAIATLGFVMLERPCMRIGQRLFA
jgi:peptidoglycan/LPS O-acetylase OafA/YrhL